MKKPLRRGQLLGKYRLQKSIGDGGFARVWRAMDTIEGVPVALKIPRPEMVTSSMLEDFRREVRITAKLDHPNILPLKTADFVEGHFVIAHPLGEESLSDRMDRRITLGQALDYGGQMLEALAYAHGRRVLHCDVKPDNFVVFAGDRLRLADFGIAKVTAKTIVTASGSGTVGYVAPEQAMGKPSFRSDCFSAGLILYRMLTGELPKWPYAWPPPGIETLRRKVPQDLLRFLRRSMEVDERKRFKDAQQMLASFQRVRPKVLAATTRRRRTRKDKKDWRDVRIRQFRRAYGKALGLRYDCRKCGGPVSEAMHCCPWCGTSRRVFRDETRFPHRCQRCRRGMKLDWKFCPWCYGPSQGPQSDRSYTDRRYEAKCSGCRGPLMPFMRYCPWCRRKVARNWKLDSRKDVCQGCGWGVASEFWRRCPWCSRSLPRGS